MSGPDSARQDKLGFSNRPGEARQKVTGEAHEKEMKLKQDFENKLQEAQNSKTVGAWVVLTQERMGKSRCQAQIDAARTSAGNLLPGIQGRWPNNLQRLRTLWGEGRNANPIGVLWFITNLEPELQTLRKTAAIDTNPATRQALADIEAALQLCLDTIGQPHEGTYTRNPFPGDPTLSARESNLARTGVFMVGAAGAIMTGIFAAFAKEGDENWILPGGYLLVAALAAGWGPLMEGSDSRFQNQIAFLVQPGGDWERLQFGDNSVSAYGMGGSEWGMFVNNYYRDAAGNTAIAAFLKGDKAPTAAQSTAIMALAPTTLRPTIEAMLKSNRGGLPAADFRMMVGLLNNATTENARAIVINYVRMGSTRRNVEAVAKGNAAPMAGPLTAGTPPIVTPRAGTSAIEPPSATTPVSTTTTPPLTLEEAVAKKVKEDAAIAKKTAEDLARSAPPASTTIPPPTPRPPVSTPPTTPPGTPPPAASRPPVAPPPVPPVTPPTPPTAPPIAPPVAPPVAPPAAPVPPTPEMILKARKERIVAEMRTKIANGVRMRNPSLTLDGISCSINGSRNMVVQDGTGPSHTVTMSTPIAGITKNLTFNSIQRNGEEITITLNVTPFNTRSDRMSLEGMAQTLLNFARGGTFYQTVVDGTTERIVTVISQ